MVGQGENAGITLDAWRSHVLGQYAVPIVTEVEHMAALLQKAEAQAFLHTHATANAEKLLLKTDKSLGADAKLLAIHIAARQRMATKLPQWVAHPEVIWPAKLHLEQSSSAATAQYKAQFWPSVQALKSMGYTHWLDATLGMGIDAAAMASAGWQVTGIEYNPTLAATTAHNLHLLAPTVSVLQGNAEEILGNELPDKTVVYLDPDRRPDAQKRAVALADCLPDVTILVPQLLSAGHAVVLKLSPLLEVAELTKRWPQLMEVTALSWKGDCRELLAVLVPHHYGAATMRAVELTAESSVMDFTASPTPEQYWAVPMAETLVAGMYVYDPGPALNKLHLADAAALHHSLKKLHPKTWLYTSYEIRENWPGRIFQLKQLARLDKKAVQQLIPEGKAQVAVRNLDITAQDLQKKLGLKDGGNEMVFGVRLAKGIWEAEVAVLVLVRV